MAVFRSSNILANCNFPLNAALCYKEVRLKQVIIGMLLLTATAFPSFGQVTISYLHVLFGFDQRGLDPSITAFIKFLSRYLMAALVVLYFVKLSNLRNKNFESNSPSLIFWFSVSLIMAQEVFIVIKPSSMGIPFIHGFLMIAKALIVTFIIAQLINTKKENSV